MLKLCKYTQSHRKLTLVRHCLKNSKDNIHAYECLFGTVAALSRLQRKYLYMY